MADMKGLKIRGSGAVQSAFIKELGGSPVTMPITEVYTSMEKGVLDGVLTAFTAMRSFKLYDVSKYSLKAGLTAAPMAVAMNKKTWDSLPPDIQKIFDKLKKKYAFECATAYDEDLEKALDMGKDKGKVIYPLSNAELKKWEKKVGPLYDQWIDDMEAKDLPGKKLLKRVQWLSKK